MIILNKLSYDLDTMDGADLILYFLEQLEIDFIFGIPGGAIEPLYNALGRSVRRNGIRPVVTRHESGAVFAADGYARQTGKLGVCCATTGPGATNLITGAANAYANQVPILSISAQTALPTFGKGAFQESSCTGIDTLGMFNYCTRYNSLVSHVDQIEQKLITAIMTAMKSPKGPVHLSIPLDILRSAVKPPHSHINLKKLLKPKATFDKSALDQLNDDIKDYSKISFVIGGGCGEAIGAIIELAEILNAKLVTTPHGKGFINPHHPLYRGVVGFAGHESAHTALKRENSDIIIAIETNLGEWASCGWDQEYLLNERLIHIDSTEENLTRSPMARTHICGNIPAIFDYLLTLHPGDRPLLFPDQRIMDSSPVYLHPTKNKHSIEEECGVKPQELMAELGKLFPPNTRYFADTGNSVAWAVHYLQPLERRSNKRRGVNAGLFRTSIEFSSMGWAIGASIGAALAYRDGPVVCITGDGSFMMHGSELSVAVAENLPVVFVILNDGALGMVKHGQRLNNAEQIGYELPNTDFSQLAEAIGADGLTIRTISDLHVIDFKNISNIKKPLVLDVRIDVEEVPPIGIRMKGLSCT